VPKSEFGQAFEGSLKARSMRIVLYFLPKNESYIQKFNRCIVIILVIIIIVIIADRRDSFPNITIFLIIEGILSLIAIIAIVFLMKSYQEMRSTASVRAIAFAGASSPMPTVSSASAVTIPAVSSTLSKDINEISKLKEDLKAISEDKNIAFQALNAISSNIKLISQKSANLELSQIQGDIQKLSNELNVLKKLIKSETTGSKRESKEIMSNLRDAFHVFEDMIRDIRGRITALEYFRRIAIGKIIESFFPNLEGSQLESLINFVSKDNFYFNVLLAASYMNYRYKTFLVRLFSNQDYNISHLLKEKFIKNYIKDRKLLRLSGMPLNKRQIINFPEDIGKITTKVNIIIQSSDFITNASIYITRGCLSRHDFLSNKNIVLETEKEYCFSHEVINEVRQDAISYIENTFNIEDINKTIQEEINFELSPKDKEWTIDSKIISGGIIPYDLGKNVELGKRILEEGILDQRAIILLIKGAASQDTNSHDTFKAYLRAQFITFRDGRNCDSYCNTNLLIAIPGNNLNEAVQVSYAIVEFLRIFRSLSEESKNVIHYQIVVTSEEMLSHVAYSLLFFFFYSSFKVYLVE
jgi:hypothetical protein